MEKDPVCGMEIDKTKAAASKEYEGRIYYFCSTSCRAKFDAAPQTFAKTAVPGHAHGGHKRCC